MWDEKKKSIYDGAFIAAPVVLHKINKSLDLESPSVIKAIFVKGLSDYPALKTLYSINTMKKVSDTELRLVDEHLGIYIQEKTGRKVLRKTLYRMYGARFACSRIGNTQQFPDIRTDEKFLGEMKKLENYAEKIGSWKCIQEQVKNIALADWVHWATQGSQMSIKTGLYWRLREIRWTYLGCSLCLSARSREEPALENCATGQKIGIGSLELLGVRAWTKRPGDPRRIEEPLEMPHRIKLSLETH